MKDGRLSQHVLRCFPAAESPAASLRLVHTPRPAEPPRRPSCTPTSPAVAAAAAGSLGPRVFLPLGHEPGYDYPLLVWFPDLAYDGLHFDLGRVMARVSLRNFVAVEAALGDADPHAAAWRAIERAESMASIHPQRVFLVGAGQGGTAALRVACRHADAFAGAASLGGRFPLDEGLFARLADVRRLPMLLTTSRDECDADPAAVERTLRVFHAAGGMLGMRIYPGRSPLSRTVLDDLNRWVMETAFGSPRVAAPTLVR